MSYNFQLHFFQEFYFFVAETFKNSVDGWKVYTKFQLLRDAKLWFCVNSFNIHAYETKIRLWSVVQVSTEFMLALVTQKLLRL